MNVEPEPTFMEKIQDKLADLGIGNIEPVRSNHLYHYDGKDYYNVTHENMTAKIYDNIKNLDVASDRLLDNELLRPKEDVEKDLTNLFSRQV